MKDIFTNLAGLVVVGIIAVPPLLFKAFVLIQLWGWFLVPLLGVSALTIPYAVGITFIIGVLFLNKKDVDLSDKEDILLNYVIYGFIIPLIYLGAGWLVTLFM